MYTLPSHLSNPSAVPLQNWPIWKEAIIIAIDSKEAKGYLDGSIICPVPVSKIPTITVTKAPGATSTIASPTLLPIITTISETY